MPEISGRGRYHWRIGGVIAGNRVGLPRSKGRLDGSHGDLHFSEKVRLLRFLTNVSRSLEVGANDDNEPERDRDECKSNDNGRAWIGKAAHARPSGIHRVVIGRHRRLIE